MNCFIDTEFTDFIDTRLISIGAVTEDGREFYAEITDVDMSVASLFVKENIVPLLGQPKDALKLTYAECGVQLANWIEGLNDRIDVMIDYGTDWDFLVDLVDDLWPTNLSSSPTVINADIQTKCVIALSSRDAAIISSGRVFDEAVDGPSQSTATREWRKKFHWAFMEHFMIAQQYQPNYKQHHALFDARANLAGWKAAISYCDSLTEKK